MNLSVFLPGEAALPLEPRTGTLDRGLLDSLDRDLLDLAWKHFVSLTCDLLVPARASIKGYS